MKQSNHFKNWLTVQGYVAAHRAYPDDMRLAGSLLFKNDLFTTTSLNRLEAYQRLLTKSLRSKCSRKQGEETSIVHSMPT